ncbi:zinc finger, CCHC-type containing protein [Tanacetum coccineum]
MNHTDRLEKSIRGETDTRRYIDSGIYCCLSLKIEEAKRLFEEKWRSLIAVSGGCTRYVIELLLIDAQEICFWRLIEVKGLPQNPIVPLTFESLPCLSIGEELCSRSCSCKRYLPLCVSQYSRSRCSPLMEHCRQLATPNDKRSVPNRKLPATFYLFFVLFFRKSFSLTSMGDENPIRTLGDYSKPSHEGYRNTITLPEGNNVVPLRSDTIGLAQSGCSFHELRSEDPNQHLKDFLKLVDSLDLDVANRERTCLCLFQFSLRDQASNWLDRLPAVSISTWEDLTTRFLAKFFPPERIAKLCNNILMFQQHQDESLSEA